MPCGPHQGGRHRRQLREASKRGRLRWLWRSLTEDRESIESQDVLAVVEALNPQGVLLDVPWSQGQGAPRSRLEDPLRQR